MIALSLLGLVQDHHLNVDDFEPMSCYEPPYSSSGPVGDNYPVEDVPPSKKKPSKGRQRKPSKKLVVEEVSNIQWTTNEESPLYQGWVRSSADSAKENSKKAEGFWTMVLSYFEKKTGVTSIVGKWKIRSYRKQFEEYMEIKRRLEVRGINTDWNAIQLMLILQNGDDEEVFTYDELFDLEEEDLNEGNEIAKIDIDVLTGDLPGFKTYEDYKNAWIYEWNNEVLWDEEKPWLENGIWKKTY
ncbi:hypothetical protein Tco_0760600 [Tanacetum coccineum]